MRLVNRLALAIAACGFGLASAGAVEPLPLPAGDIVIPPAAPAAPPLEPVRQMVLPGDLPIDNRDEPLSLGEVLESVRRHYPLLRAI